MTGHRPGLYWQITWRFVGPAALVLLLFGSLYEKIRDSPKYTAWDSETVSSFKRAYRNFFLSQCTVKAIVFTTFTDSTFQGETKLLPFPGWTMGIALFLIILGVLPILVVWLMNVFNILGPSGRARSASTTMRRIDTSASTRPMMDDYEVRLDEQPWFRRLFSR